MSLSEWIKENQLELKEPETSQSVEFNDIFEQFNIKGTFGESNSKNYSARSNTFRESKTFKEC